MMLGFSGCGSTKYRVDYDGHKAWYRGAKDAYRAGQQVTLYYDMIATDTDYAFYLDGEQLNAVCSEDKGFMLCFTMPAHDVKISMTQVNSMVETVDAGMEKEAVLKFHSFDGGGPQFTVTVDDPAIVACKSERNYGKANHEELDGAGYDVIYIFTGLQPGETQVLICARSPIGDNFDARYTAQVNDALRIRLTELYREEVQE